MKISELTTTQQFENDPKNAIYTTLKQKLIHCDYPPGTYLNESMLTEEFKVSRTPIREAISRLEMHGYVKVIPKKGIYVTDITLEDVLQIFQTRIEIEPLTLRMASPYLDYNRLIEFRTKFDIESKDLNEAYKLDKEMHLYIISCCRNRYLIEMLNKLFDDNTRIVIATKQNEVKIHNASMEHIEILESLIYQKDPATSADLMRTHIIACRDAALKFFSDRGFYSN